MTSLLASLANQTNCSLTNYFLLNKAMHFTRRVVYDKNNRLFLVFSFLLCHAFILTSPVAFAQEESSVIANSADKKVNLQTGTSGENTSSVLQKNDPSVKNSRGKQTKSAKDSLEKSNSNRLKADYLQNNPAQIEKNPLADRGNARNALTETLNSTANASSTGSSTASTPPTDNNGQTAVASPDGQAFYQEPFSVASESSSNSTYVYLILRMFLVLGAFLVVAYFVFRILRKRNEQLIGNNPLFRSIADFPLSVNSKLAVIRIIKDYHVFIISKENVAHVQQIVDRESIDEIKIIENQSGPSNVNFFKDFLSAYSQQAKNKNKPVPRPGVKSSLQITRSLQERLKNSKLKL